MKKIFVIIIVLFSFINNSYCGSNKILYRWPLEIGLTFGNVSTNINTLSYHNTILPKSFNTFGLKSSGLFWIMGYEHIYLDENVLGYNKVVDCSYDRMGLELGKFYYLNRNNKLHSFSVAITYSKLDYGIRDTSGNNIGWSSWDNNERSKFYSNNETNIKLWGVTFEYVYEFLGIDVSINEKMFEISLVFVLDMQKILIQ